MRSIIAGAGDIKSNAAAGGQDWLSTGFNFLSGLIFPGAGGAAPTAAAASYGPQWQYAMGGVAPGGFKAFASGGVVNKPTLGLVGEGVYNEAIVPLPDGKSIPVKMAQPQGPASGNISSSVNVTLNNNGSGDRSTAGDGSRLSDAIEAAVMQVLIRERRNGGVAY
jgi:phage-related minor tail protein